MFKNISEELFNFIENSPSCFHTIEEIKKNLLNNGFVELHEQKKWSIENGKSYFVTRNQSSIIAFKVGEKLDDYSFNITASHSDSPSFKLKENLELSVNGKYKQLNTEKYGGMLYSTWLDRPLSVAGRIVVKTNEGIEVKLVDIDRDLVMIPNLAIHMNKEANSGYSFNPQIDLLPLYGMNEDKNFMDIVAEEVSVAANDIIGTDLYLYNRMKPSIWGANNEFISAPKLDDLQCAFTSLKAFLNGYNENAINVYCCFDNEEVGSTTKQGAASTFMKDVLTRINTCLGKTEEQYHCALASSLLLSADNAHAVHPNHPGKSDATNRAYINEGIVIKYNANQKYTTDAISASIFKSYCEKAEVPYQSFTNRSDMMGGSTLGNIASTQVSINMVDIGLPQLAMHSSYETAGIKDTYYMYKAIEKFYNSKLSKKDNYTYIIND